MSPEVLGIRRGTVHLLDHDPRWASFFASAASQITEATGIPAERIQHVGSTSVLGLAAKPILDVVLGVTEGDSIDGIASQLVGLGYIDRGGGRGSIGRLIVRESSPEVRTVHVHIVAHGTRAWRDYTDFRDALKSDVDLRRRYAEMKGALARRFPRDRRSYRHGKDAFIEETLDSLRPSNLKILAYQKTPLGDLCLRRRELLSRPGTVITEITLDHQLLMSSYNTVSERALAEEALARHSGHDLSVLVAGLGLGYTAAAVLQSANVKRVEVVELFPAVVGFLRDGLVPLSSELLADPRFSVREGDAYALLGEPADERWDLVLVDVDHSPEDHLGAGNASFYTASGLARAKDHLAPGGILAVWSYAESSPFVDALRSAFVVVEVVPVSYTNDLVDEEHTDWLFLARDEPGTVLP